MDRSLTPGRGSNDPAPAAHPTSFGHGMDTMNAIDQETLNVVPGIDDEPDDAEPWAANLSFADLMDLGRTIKRELVDSARFFKSVEAHVAV